MQVTCKHIWCKFNEIDDCKLDIIELDHKGCCSSAIMLEGEQLERKIDEFIRQAGIAVVDYDKKGRRI